MPMPVQAAPLVEWACWYASQGHPVFPLHTPLSTGCSCRREDCPDIGKHPRIKGGLTNATTDVARLRSWWKQWPLANIGLRTGITFWALDIDPRKGGDDELHSLEQQYGELPETPRSKTGGGGLHIAFALPPEGIIRNKVNMARGIDIRGEGGYIVVPPSLHTSGQIYCWDAAADLEDTPLAQAPPWLLERIQATIYAPPTQPDQPIPNGQRNETLSRMAFAMRKAGMSLKEMHAGLEAVNMARCITPLDAEELLLIIEGKRDIGPDPILKPSSKKDKKTPEVCWPKPTKWDEMADRVYPERRWLVKGLIPDGMTIIGGSPKVAKSYVAYDLALATVGQGLALGHFGCERGGALYCAIEDDERDSKARVLQIRQLMPKQADLYFVNTTEVPSFSQGLLDYIRLMVTEYQLALVVIDPLMYVYDVLTNSRDPFREVKDALLPFRQMAVELQFSLVFVDHRRKENKDDVDIFQTLYGSQAKQAITDSLIMVERYSNEVTFHCKGRAIKEQKLHFTFTHNEDNNTFVWGFAGEGRTFASGSLRQQIFDAFKDAEAKGHRALSVKDILDFSEMLQTTSNVNNVRQAVFQMYKKGLLLRTDTGLFTRAHDDDDRGVVV